MLRKAAGYSLFFQTAYSKGSHEQIPLLSEGFCAGLSRIKIGFAWFFLWETTTILLNVPLFVVISASVVISGMSPHETLRTQVLRETSFLVYCFLFSAVFRGGLNLSCMCFVFQESVLNFRLDPLGIVEGFTAEVGASGVFCPTHMTLPVEVSFYSVSDDNAPSPYMVSVWSKFSLLCIKPVRWNKVRKLAVRWTYVTLALIRHTTLMLAEMFCN